MHPSASMPCLMPFDPNSMFYLNVIGIEFFRHSLLQRAKVKKGGINVLLKKIRLQNSLNKDSTDAS